MAVTVKRRIDKSGWWVFINHREQRRKKSFGTNKALAVEFAKKLDAKLKLGEAGVRTQSGITIDAYAVTWLERIRHARKHTTHEDYQARLTRDILPLLTGLDLDDITRERVKAVAFAGLTRQQAPKTVQNTIRVLSSLLSHAKEDGLIQQNHAMRPGSFLPTINKRQAVDPLTRAEVATFLATVRDHAPRYYPLFLCAVRTGLRMGEVLALQWADCDFHGRFLHIQRNYTHWKLTTPKSGQSRRVDMSRALCQDLQVDRQFDAAATGTAVPLWVFRSETGGLLHPHNLRDRIFYGLLKKAGLRQVRFHDLRHTFASLLLQQGESPVYVKEQLGHSSIQITVDCYGHLIPGGNKQAVDRLDEGEVSDASKNEKLCVSLST